MRIKHLYYLLILGAFLIINSSDMAYAERKLLSPPGLLTFNPEEHLNREYKKEIKNMEKLLKKHNDAISISKISELYKTTRKDSSKKIIMELSNEIKKYEKKDINLLNDLRLRLKKIEQKVEEGSFNKHRTGVDFKIDEKNREYIVSWKENGKEVIKRTPFVPEMKLIVKAGYIPKIRDNKNIMVYQYWIENKKESKASFSQLYIENKFSQSYILDRIKSKYGKMSIFHKIKLNLILDISYPEGYLNYFRFFIADTETEMLIKYHAGEKMDYPYEFDEIEGGLPGIIECYVPVSYSEYNPYGSISAEDDPEMAVDIFRDSNERPRFMYSGITIGPVPIPDPFDKTKFIEQIILYNNQSIEEGWYDKPTVIKFTQEGLEKIKNNPENRKQTKDFLTKLEEYHKKKMILSEAYALLRYNLEYLFSKSSDSLVMSSFLQKWDTTWGYPTVAGIQKTDGLDSRSKNCGNDNFSYLMGEKEISC